MRRRVLQFNHKAFIIIDYILLITCYHYFCKLFQINHYYVFLFKKILIYMQILIINFIPSGYDTLLTSYITWGLSTLAENPLTICLSMIELLCYVWWLSYILICNHFGWNETIVLEVERKSRYHGYIYIYMLQYDWIDVLCVMIQL